MTNIEKHTHCKICGEMDCIRDHPKGISGQQAWNIAKLSLSFFIGFIIGKLLCF